MKFITYDIEVDTINLLKPHIEFERDIPKEELFVDGKPKDDLVYLKSWEDIASTRIDVYPFSALFKKENIVDMVVPFKLKCYNRFNEYHMRMPKTLVGNVETLLKHMSNTKDYVLKPINLNRSVGITHVTKSKLRQMQHDAQEMDIDTFNHTHEVNVSEALNYVEVTSLRNAIKDDILLVLQEDVKHKHEYRIIYFKGAKVSDYLVVKRTNYHPNALEPRENIELSKSEIKKIPYLYIILEAMKEFGDALPHPYLSLDVYVDRVDTHSVSFGMFEYSTEFGYKHIQDTDALGKKMADSIRFTLKRQRSEI